MANKVIAFRTPKMLISAMDLAADINGVERNEDILLRLTLAYAPYIRMIEAKTTTSVNPPIENKQLEVAA